jgi:hypothetical protein
MKKKKSFENRLSDFFNARNDARDFDELEDNQVFHSFVKWVRLSNKQ